MSQLYKRTLETIPQGVLIFKKAAREIVFSNRHLAQMLRIQIPICKKDLYEEINSQLKQFTSSESLKPQVDEGVFKKRSSRESLSSGYPLSHDSNEKMNLMEFIFDEQMNGHGELDCVFKKKDLLSKIHIQIKVAHINNDEQIIVIASDISRLKHLESITNKMKSMFFSSIAHELRTPLNTILPITQKLMNMMKSAD